MSLGRMLQRQLSPVTSHVFLSGVTGVKDTAMMLDAKISHVLNLARELEDLTYPDHVKVKFVSLEDSESENILPHLDDLVDHVHQVVSQDQGRIVVHCVAGVSRSASVCIAYLIKHHDMALVDAYKSVKEAREVIYPNLGFWAALIEYEEQIRGSNSVELLPHVAGTIPSLDDYQKDMKYRIRLGWMDHVFFNLFFHFLFLSVQMVTVNFFHYDFT